LDDDQPMQKLLAEIQDQEEGDEQLKQNSKPTFKATVAEGAKTAATGGAAVPADKKAEAERRAIILMTLQGAAQDIKEGLASEVTSHRATNQ